MVPKRGGKVAAAEAIIRENIGLTIRKLEDLLQAAKIKRGRDWVMKTKAAIKAEAGEAVVGG